MDSVQIHADQGSTVFIVTILRAIFYCFMVLDILPPSHSCYLSAYLYIYIIRTLERTPALNPLIFSALSYPIDSSTMDYPPTRTYQIPNSED